MARNPPSKPNKENIAIKGAIDLFDLLAPSVSKRALLFATKDSFVLVL